ncbi:MAG: hypothetical protein ACYDAS_04405 [Patescibacteria group bacterium]
MDSKITPKIKNIRFSHVVSRYLITINKSFDDLISYIVSSVILLIAIFIFIINITPSVYAQNFAQGFTQSSGKQTVNIHAYAPLLNNWAYIISSQGKIYTKLKTTSHTIYMNEKIPIYVQTFGTKKAPLRDQTIFLSSPDTKYGLHIIEPKIPTNVKGLTEGYITSTYKKPTVYTIIATDTTYAEAPVVFKNMLQIQYYPSKNYKPSIFVNITNYLGNLFSSTTNILDILSIVLAIITFLIIEKRLLISKISITIQNQYRILFGIIKILFIPYLVSIFALYNQHSIINYVALAILAIVSVHFILVYVKNLKDAVSRV